MTVGRLDLAPPLMAGFKLHMEGVRIPASEAVQAQKFGADETGILLSLCSMADGTTQALGTAFLVLPGLAMTAAHVVAEYEGAGRLDRGLLLLIGLFGTDLRSWEVTNVRMPVEGDVALLEAVPRFAHGEVVSVNHVSLTARMPKIGEPLLALGLIADRIDFPHDHDGEEGSWISVAGLAATGTVFEFYPRRDANLPGPTLRCNIKAPGGMSGGPVFDRDGYVCGIVSASMEIEGEWESFVSLHWFALMFETQPPWPEGLFKRATLWPGHVHENWHLGLGGGDIAYFEN